MLKICEYVQNRIQQASERERGIIRYNEFGVNKVADARDYILAPEEYRTRIANSYSIRSLPEPCQRKWAIQDYVRIYAQRRRLVKAAQSRKWFQLLSDGFWCRLGKLFIR